MHGQCGMSIDDPLGHGACHTTCMGDPYCLSNPEALQPRPFTHQGEVVHGEGEQTIHRFDNLAGLQCGNDFGRKLHGTFPLPGSEWHLARHHFSEFTRKDVLGPHSKWAMSVPANRETLSSLPEIKVRTLMTEHGQFSLTLVRGQFRHWPRIAKLVRQRLYSLRHTHHRSNFRSPYSSAGNNDIC